MVFLRSQTETNGSEILRSDRNKKGLEDRQIEICREVWKLLCGRELVELDCSEAGRNGSQTRFNEDQNKVFLGADAYPGGGILPHSNLSYTSCLAHEWAHAVRFRIGFHRDAFEKGVPHEDQPDVLIDEAEASIHAAIEVSVLTRRDREELIADARDHLNQWLEIMSKRRELDHDR